jgi:hypothetical protein
MGRARAGAAPVEASDSVDSLALAETAELETFEGARLIEHEEEDLSPEEDERAEGGEDGKPPAAHSAIAAIDLTLTPANLARGAEVRAEFESGNDGEVGERLLENLVAAEVPIAMQLQDIEAAVAGLLSRSLAHPEVALHAAKLLRESVAVSNAVRLRIERSIGTIASLRAQRRFLAVNRGQRGN